MKKLFSYLWLLLVLFSLGGCQKNATIAVKEYLNKYNSLDDDVIKNINDVASKEGFDEDNKEVYISILKKQYTDMDYEIIDEDYDGDEATIKVKITVYDLYKIQSEANDYLANNLDEFNDENGEYDVNKFISYKLEQMKNASQRIDYTIDFYVVNTSDGWVVSSLSNSDLEKIHGIYNYES